MLFSSTPRELLNALKDSEFLRALGVSLRCSLISSLMVLLLGVPFSYLLVRYSFPLKGFLDALVELPTAIPHSVAGIAILYTFGKWSYLGKLLSTLGLRVYGDYFGITLAMAFVSAPYFIASVREGIRAIPKEYELISYSLGRGKFFTFFKIVIPLSASHILRGFILAWGRAISEFGAVMVVAYFPMTATVFVYERLESLGIRVTLPYAVIMLIVTGALFMTLRLIWGRYAEGRKS